MPTFRVTPTLPEAPSTGPFIQTVILTEQNVDIGKAIWAVNEDASVFQILHIHITAEHRRAGTGGTLLDETLRSIKQFARQRGVKPRRVWIVVEQKSQVIARAFLTRQGFHHTTTISNLLKDQDALVYQKAFD